MLSDPYWPFFNPCALATRDDSYLRRLRPQLTRVAQVKPLLSFAEARLHLKLDPLPLDEDGALLDDADVPAHPDDVLVKGMALAAQAEVDGPSSFTGRGFAHTQWKLSLRGFPTGPLFLPLPPLLSVDSVTYRALDGSRVTVSGSLYSVRPSSDLHPGAVYLHGSDPWPTLPAYPSAAVYDDAVEVTFTTGAPDGDPETELVKAYARLRLGSLYENREAHVIGTSVTALPGWEHMLENLRVAHPDFLS